MTCATDAKATVQRVILGIYDAVHGSTFPDEATERFVIDLTFCIPDTDRRNRDLMCVAKEIS